MIKLARDLYRVKERASIKTQRRECIAKWLFVCLFFFYQDILQRDRHDGARWHRLSCTVIIVPLLLREPQLGSFTAQHSTILSKITLAISIQSPISLSLFLSVCDIQDLLMETTTFSNTHPRSDEAKKNGESLSSGRKELAFQRGFLNTKKKKEENWNVCVSKTRRRERSFTYAGQTDTVRDPIPRARGEEVTITREEQLLEYIVSRVYIKLGLSKRASERASLFHHHNPI